MSIRFLPAALIAVVIALIAVGGAALALGIDGSNSKNTDDLLDRAANELGVAPQALKDAHAQARSELTTERQQEILANLVESEVITQEQSDKASAWLDQKPDAVDKLMRPELLIGMAGHASRVVVFDSPFGLNSPVPGEGVTGKMAEILGIDPEALENALGNARKGQVEDSRTEAINNLIAELVADGEITQVEGDEIKIWLDAMPEWLGDDGLLFRIFSHGFDAPFGGPFGRLELEGIPFLHEFGDGPFFQHPGEDGFRFERDGTLPFLFGPEGEFEFPEFKSRTPRGGDHDGVPGNRYFYRGPEGEFNFDGEIPPDFEHLFEGLGERFDFDNLNDLLEQFGPFPGFPQGVSPFGPPPASESDSDVSDAVANVKGA